MVSLFDVEGILSYEQLQLDYGLPKSDDFHYLQLRYWVTSLTYLVKASRPLTPFEKWLTCKQDETHMISELYVMLATGQKWGGRTKDQLR